MADEVPRRIKYLVIGAGVHVLAVDGTWQRS